MRHRRLRQRIIAPWPEDKPTPVVVAGRASYVGSAEHKTYPSAAGHPALRSDASRCDPRYTDFEQITQALREGIQRRCASGVFDGDYPKYVWGWLDGRLYEARLINSRQGTYKGYPLEEVETPRDDDGLLNWDAEDA
ncbi:MAG: hypothetical protein ACYC35_20535 [Pirellulales bacterium]